MRTTERQINHLGRGHRGLAQIIAVGEQMATRGGGLADPQEVVDRIFQCVRGEAPVHNPTGSDADMLIGMMGQDKRQTFLDQLEAMLIPAPAASR